MVVDDDPDVRFVVSSLLALEFETTQASNGLDALEKIDRYEPDMLLVDINMPVMNGIACCAAIKRNPSFEQIPVIFLSASSDPKVRQDAMSAGGVAFIEKPFDTAALIDTIQRHFQAANARPAAKRYSIDEIERIDATPLEMADTEGIEPQSLLLPPGAQATVALEGFDEDNKEGRTRRKFGKQQPKTTPIAPALEPPLVLPPPKPAAADDATLLPPPPAPDYGRVSREYVQKLKTPPKPAEPPPPAKAPQPPAQIAPQARPPVAPPARPTIIPATPPRVEPPRMQPPIQPLPPVAPATAAPIAASAAGKPTAPSPAEILAQRRMAVLGGVAGKSSPKPRALVIIDNPEMLERCNSALKGSAEFLPLEDPVEALVLIARFQPDIVMMGIHEQNFSGLQIAGMLRGNPRLSHIEILFVQSPWADSGHLNAARQLTKNQIIRRPVAEAQVKEAIGEITARPGFRIREKNLTYGVYVKEVIRAAESERAKQNKFLEKRAHSENVHSLSAFMASELRGYREPAGYDELKGPGNKVHNVRE